MIFLKHEAQARRHGSTGPNSHWLKQFLLYCNCLLLRCPFDFHACNAFEAILCRAISTLWNANRPLHQEHLELEYNNDSMNYTAIQSSPVKMWDCHWNFYRILVCISIGRKWMLNCRSFEISCTSAAYFYTVNYCDKHKIDSNSNTQWQIKFQTSGLSRYRTSPSNCFLPLPLYAAHELCAAARQ